MGGGGSGENDGKSDRKKKMMMMGKFLLHKQYLETSDAISH